MRVLVTGASGLLGGRLALLLGERCQVVAATRDHPPPPGLSGIRYDLSAPGAAATLLDQAQPEAVLHCAALANPDACEADPGLADRLNVVASSELAELCQRRGLRLVALSTDLVLPGDAPFSDESRPVAPQLAYARSKRAAEETILAKALGAAVARVPLILGRGFGPRGTASESIAWALRSGRPLRLFSDQYRTPVDPESLLPALEALLRGRGRGLFHLGGPERVSRLELGQRVAVALGLDATAIQSALQATGNGAPRPSDVSLDSSRARRELGYAPRPIEEGILEGRAEPAGSS